jgi:hypothetical protein
MPATATRAPSTGGSGRHDDRGKGDHDLLANAGEVDAVAVEPGSSMLAVAFGEGQPPAEWLQILDPRTGAVTTDIDLGSFVPHAMAFDRTHTILVAAGEVPATDHAAGELHTWDLTTADQRDHYADPRPLRAVFVAPDGALVTAGDRGVVVTVTNGTVLEQGVPSSSAWVLSLLGGNGPDDVFAGDNTGVVTHLAVHGATPPAPVFVSERAVEDLAAIPSDNEIVAATRNGDAWTFTYRDSAPADSRTGDQMQVQQGPLRSVVVSSDGTLCRRDTDVPRRRPSPRGRVSGARMMEQFRTS